MSVETSQTRRVQDIDYDLLPGTERKTTDIVIERDGRVAVRPPAHLSPEQVDAVVHSKRMWIYRSLAEWRDLNASATAREWVSGETFLYLGRSHKLELVKDQHTDLLLSNGRFCLRRDVIDHGGSAAAKAVFERFYTAKGEQRFQDRVRVFASKAGVEPGPVRVKEMGYRWASATKSGALNFHWKCMMAPAKVIDYIVVHELCHLHVREHTEEFWNEVDKVLPDYRERADWLKRRGAAFTL